MEIAAPTSKKHLHLGSWHLVLVLVLAAIIFISCHHVYQLPAIQAPSQPAASTSLGLGHGLLLQLHPAPVHKGA
jgi:hypothetical protein